MSGKFTPNQLRFRVVHSLHISFLYPRMMSQTLDFSHSLMINVNREMLVLLCIISCFYDHLLNIFQLMLSGL